MAGDSSVRDAVVLATLKVIGRSGLSGVTHRAVAEQAGLSLGAVTYYCRSRDELVEAALQSAIERETGRQDALSRRLARGGFGTAKWIEHLAHWYTDELSENRDVHLACYEAFMAAARTEKYRESIAALQEAWHKSAETALSAAGVSRASERASVFVAALTGMLLEELALPRRGTFSRFTSRLTQLVEGWA